MDFDCLLKERKSIRSYSVKNVSFENIIKICEAARYSPMAGNIYTVRLIIVSNKETKQKLVEAALDQEFILDAPYIIVVCSDISNLERAYGERAAIYSRQQAGAAIENMLLKVTELGLASCWIGAFEENAVKRILNIPDKIQVEAILPIANPLGEPQAKKKPELKQIVYFEKWNQTMAKPLRRLPT